MLIHLKGSKCVFNVGLRGVEFGDQRNLLVAAHVLTDLVVHDLQRARIRD